MVVILWSISKMDHEIVYSMLNVVIINVVILISIGMYLCVFE